MFHSSQILFRRNAWRVCCVCVVTALPVSLHAAVVNKYTFNQGNANDSVGGQHGTLVDNTGIATFAGGTLNLSANNGAGSGQDFSLPTTVGAYVDLPNLLLNNAINGGNFGQASMEVWFTIQQNRPWAEVFNFGDGPDGVSGDGGGRNYVALIPHSDPPTGPDDFRGTTRDFTNAEAAMIGSATPLAVGIEHHVVMTFDIFDATASPTGTATLYHNDGTNPTTVVSAALLPFLDQVIDNNNWLGRSPWGGDPLFDGLIDEFRIHDTALTAGDIASSFTVGPEAALLPVLVVNRDTGAITIKNESGSNIQLKGYSITSVGGALNTATWTSIDAGNTFDPNGLWTAQSSTAFNLSESNTGQTLDGGTLTANNSAGIGTPWRKTPIEDIAFNFTLGDNSPGSGIVQYIGTAALRSDLDGNGSINVADWALFVPNSFTALTGQSAVAAYLKGDLDGDFDNDYQDFQLFKADYIEANGLSAFNSLMSVPEPSSVILLTMASAMLMGVRRK